MNCFECNNNKAENVLTYLLLLLLLLLSRGVRLSPLGTVATVWPTVPAPDGR
jgi:hypothetical protein